MKTKHFKSRHALLMSLTSLMLCVSMLFGATFAWFTDSVTSGVNRIVSGNLDVELYHKNNETPDTKVDGMTKLFNVAADGYLWEPEAMAYETFEVHNEGTLALKYQLALVNAGNNTVTRETETKSLLDVIKVAVIDGTDEINRELIKTNATTSLKNFIGSVNNTAGILYPSTDTTTDHFSTKTFTVALYWPQSEGDNFYNLKDGWKADDNTDKLYVDLGITLVATQVQNESDSFGIDYDAASTYPSASVDGATFVPTTETVSATVASAGTTTMTAAVAPVSSAATTVVFDEGALTVAQDAAGSAKLTVTTEDVEAASAKSFSVLAGNTTDSAVATIDLTLTVDGEDVKSFNGKSATVTTYVAPGLNGVTIKYQADDTTIEVWSTNAADDAHKLTYNSTTGELTFTTTHFSEYVVTASDALYNAAENKGYATLAAFRDAWNDGTTTKADIVMLKNADISDSEWLPIGNWQYPFNGTFDGNGRTISGMNKTMATDKDVYATGNTIGYGPVFGFFAIVGNGDVTVRNINFADVNISLSGAGKNVGTVIGYAPGSDNFKAVKDGNDWSAKWTENASIGTHNVTIENVTTKGSLACNSHGGGIMGKMYSSGKLNITNTVNDVDVNAAGGSACGMAAIINNCNNVTITGCTNKGDITGAGGYTSGIFNSSVVTSNNVIKNCVNEGTISDNSGSGFVSGVIAVGDGNITVQNLENKGSVTASNAEYIGGVLSGTGNQTITISEGHLKNSGAIEGKKLAGGVTGRINSAMEIAENVVFENSGSVSVTGVGTASSVNHPYGAGAIFAYLGNANSFTKATFKNSGTVTAPEGSHTGLVAAAISNATFSFNNCTYVNNGTITKLDSNQADPDLSNRSHKYSVGFNSVEKGVFGFVPKDTGNILLGENENTQFALFTDELAVLIFDKDDSEWTDNTLQKEIDGYTYKITREQKEA